MNQYAVITGASKGLGKCFAIELASRKINTILVSLPNQGLQDLSNELKERFGIDSQFFETDLSIYDNVTSLVEWINHNFQISVLINNAGIGGSKSITDADINYINKILQLNVVATSVLTHQLLQNLLSQPRAYILNVSSLAALNPIGYKTVYPASKAFVYSFSRSLCEELKNTNVFVSVVNPGAMATNDDVTKRIKSQGFFGRLTLLNPEKVACTCINGLFKRKREIIVNPFSWFSLKILPNWITLPLLTKTVKREIKVQQ